MRGIYLQVTYRRGRPIAAYLYLPRRSEDKSYRTAKADPGLIVDFNQDGKAIGIELTAPMEVRIEDLNRVLQDLELPPVQNSDLTPLQAA